MYQKSEKVKARLAAKSCMCQISRTYKSVDYCSTVRRTHILFVICMHSTHKVLRILRLISKFGANGAYGAQAVGAGELVDPHDNCVPRGVSAGNEG